MSMRPLLFLLALLPLTAEAAAASQAKPLNVLIVAADSLRPDHLSLYGYERPTSPHLDLRAKEAVVFDQAFAQGAYTLSSFASLFTSRYPEQHHAVHKFAALTEAETMLAEVFQKAGYRTGGLTGGPNLSCQYGFDKGFDSYLCGDLPRKLDAYIQPALRWIEKDRARPFLLFIQPQDVHPPFDMLALPENERNRWDPDYKGPIEDYLGSFFFFRAFTGESYQRNGPEPSAQLKKTLSELAKDPAARRHMASVYDDRVAHLDASLDRFLVELERRGILRDTIVVLLSDHGTLFGEGGNFAHGWHMSTHDAIFHVVLAFWAPGLAPRRIPSPVELVDVAPTLLDMAGLPRPEAFEGRSLTALMRGREKPAERPVFGASSATVGTSNQLRHYVREAGWKLVAEEPGGKVSLFNLASDPEEVRDVSAENPGEVRRLSRLLPRHLQKLLSGL